MKFSDIYKAEYIGQICTNFIRIIIFTFCVLNFIKFIFCYDFKKKIRIIFVLNSNYFLSM